MIKKHIFSESGTQNNSPEQVKAYLIEALKEQLAEMENNPNWNFDSSLILFADRQDDHISIAGGNYQKLMFLIHEASVEDVQLQIILLLLAGKHMGKVRRNDVNMFLRLANESLQDAGKDYRLLVATGLEGQDTAEDPLNDTVTKPE